MASIKNQDNVAALIDALDGLRAKLEKVRIGYEDAVDQKIRLERKVSGAGMALTQPEIDTMYTKFVDTVDAGSIKPHWDEAVRIFGATTATEYQEPTDGGE